MRNRFLPMIGVALMAATLFGLVSPADAATSRSPVSYSIGDLAGDFVVEKETKRVWYIDTETSRRWQIVDSDNQLFDRMKQAAEAKPWFMIFMVQEAGVTSTPMAKKTSLRGLVYDEGVPDLLWHVQRRANKRQALRSREDVLNYVKKAMEVSAKTLEEYPIAYADYDYAIKDPAKVPDVSVSSTRPDLGKFINISLKEQRLRAYENGRLVNTFLISSGRGKFPTPKGDFSVLAKVPVVHYKWTYAVNSPDNYDLGLVPYNLRIMPHKYIHYAYWHNAFGRTMSHGCVNVNLKNIKWIYRWSDEGVPVYVH